MEEAKVFERILLNNEYIIKTYRPNRKRWIWNTLYSPLVIMICFCGVVGMIVAVNIINQKNLDDFSFYVPIIILAGILIFFFTLGIINGILNAKNTYYAVTNKRLIAKIGKREDYFQFYDLKDLGYSQIKVTYLDKKMHPNTGTIIFSNRYFNKGIIVQKMNGPQTYIFSFNFIENPYEVSKYISSLAEQAKLEE